MVVHGVAGATPDELLRTLGSTGVHTETVAASANGTPIYAGPDRLVPFRLIVGGTVTGTSPTLDVKAQICSDASGTGAADAGSFPQQTASMATATGALAAFPRITVRTTVAKPYIRIVKTVGGTTPSFGGVAVIAEPMGSFAP